MEHPDSSNDPQTAEPANLKFLRRLVTALTITMIFGVLVIVVLIVMRFRDIPPVLPETLVLPEGAQVVSFTQGPDWFAVVTDTNVILIYDRVTGELTQRIDIDSR